MPHSANLSKRERQIMEIIYRKGSVSVEEVRTAMPQPVSYSAVRVIVNVLERKGHLKHTKLGKKYVYRATTPRARAVREALKHLIHTYFGDSLHTAVAAMVQLHAKDLSDEDMRRLVDVIEQSKEEGLR
ncbi:MAG: BlaI/MecI/CopY family transcriptional regulator [Spirochaetia bacterium]